MAVFPDRIVLKNATGMTGQELREAIGSGGEDEIVQGEIVLSLGNGYGELFALDELGEVVSLGGTGRGDLYLTNLLNVSTLDPNFPTQGQALLYDQATQMWLPGDVSTGGGSSGGLAFWGGGNFTTGVSDGEPADGGVFTI